MNIAGINTSSQSNTPVQQPAQDNYETDIRKQISNLQEKMKNISNNKEMSSEQKVKERQAVQEEIQNLNSELRQYQIQKRQEEAQKRQEELKQAAENAEIKAENQQNIQSQTGFGDKEAGVIISISTSKEQMADMKRIRTNLEGRQLTAETDEEKERLQKKINNVSRGIGEKIKITEDTISEFQEARKYGDEKSKRTENKEEVIGQKSKVAVVNTEKDIEEQNRINAIRNNKKPFEDVSVITKG